MLSLDTIKPAKGSVKKRKTIGRGNSSGHGTYSCRGMKGQRARSGVGGLKRMAMKSRTQQIPKLRGFKSIKAKDFGLNLGSLNDIIKDNDVVEPKILLKAGLIDSLNKTIKLLGDGTFDKKNITVVNIKLSKSAQEKIEALGGKISQ
jgi:large subunit ribosomal protein L15